MEQTAVHGSLLDDGDQSVYAEAPLRLSADVFVQLWPAVEPAVLRSLRRRGVPAATAEDVTQEVAVRALDREFESRAHVRRWCTRVAVNLAIDDRRRQGNIESGEIPDAEVPAAGDHAVLRLELSRVAAAIAGLSEVDQSVLRIAAAGESVTGEKRDRDRFALQLFRARKRLLDALKGWLGLGGVVALGQRRRTSLALAMVAVVTALSWSTLIHRADVPKAGDAATTLDAGAAEVAVRIASAHDVARPHDAVPTPATRARPPATPDRFRTQIDVPSPSGGPLVRVGAEDHGDEPRPLLCLRNLPVVGEYCSTAPPSF